MINFVNDLQKFDHDNRILPYCGSSIFSIFKFKISVLNLSRLSKTLKTSIMISFINLLPKANLKPSKKNKRKQLKT